MGLWLKVPDMNHAVLIPGEKRQCGQRADQTKAEVPAVPLLRNVTFLGSREEEDATS